MAGLLLMAEATLWAAAGPVTLVEDIESLTLSNTFASISFNKDPATGRAHSTIDAVRAAGYSGRQNLLRSGQTAYWNFVQMPDGPSSKKDCTFSDEFVGHRVVRNTSAIVEIAFEHPADCGFSAELHYVMRAQDSGFFFFLVVTRNGSMTPMALQSLRWSMRLDQDIFKTVIVPNEDRTATTPAWQLARPRSAVFPEVSSLTEANEVMNAAYRIHNASPTGQDVPSNFYTKYSWAVSAGADLVHGTVSGKPDPSGQHVGAFLMQPSHEYLNGGPAHPEIAVHVDPKSVCFLFHGAGSHYNYVPPIAPIGWQKLIGPAFVQLDTDATVSGLWERAKSAASEFSRAWPYTWMSHPLWSTAADRGSVFGTLLPTAPLDLLRVHEWGYAVLAEPLPLTLENGSAMKWPEVESGVPPLDMQGLGYIFYAPFNTSGDKDERSSRSNRSGRSNRFDFEIQNVRAGNYSLWVRLPGCVPVQQLLVPRLTVISGQATPLGAVTVSNRRQARTRLWQIGVADASVAEFRHGKAAMAHGYMLWLNYTRDFPTGVNFTVGKSDPQQEWNFMQPLLNRSTIFAIGSHKKNPKIASGQGDVEQEQDALSNTWRARFDTSELRHKYHRLAITIGILSANSGATHEPQLDVLLNGALVACANATVFMQPLHPGQQKQDTTHVDIRAWVISGSVPPFEVVVELNASAVAALPAMSTLELVLSGTPKARSCVGVICPSASVLYDFIRLEGDEVLPTIN